MPPSYGINLARVFLRLPTTCERTMFVTANPATKMKTMRIGMYSFINCSQIGLMSPADLILCLLMLACTGAERKPVSRLRILVQSPRPCKISDGSPTVRGGTRPNHISSNLCSPSRSGYRHISQRPLFLYFPWLRRMRRPRLDTISDAMVLCGAKSRERYNEQILLGRAGWARALKSKWLKGDPR